MAVIRNWPLMWVATLLLACSDGWAFEAFRPLPSQPPIPANNPMTEAKITLGRALFEDRRLSFTGVVACGSCHDLDRGGDDDGSVSVGALGVAGKRSAPSLWNIGFQTVYFWDGRAASLEEAVESHLFSPTEMALPNAATLKGRLIATDEYRRAFVQVFGAPEAYSARNVAKALAAYLRTLVAGDSPFDRYLTGDTLALDEAAQRGFKEYIDTGCASCHFWVNLAGPVPGLAFKMGEGFYELFPNYRNTPYELVYDLADDLGRYQVTGDEAHRHLWRVPSLRNVALTAPYFHNGSVATLDEAVRVMAKTQLDKELSPRQVSDIVSFLQALTGRVAAPKTSPEGVPPSAATP